MSSMEKLNYLRIPLKGIISATNNFDDGSLIGEGGFGKVYKAKLSYNNDHSIIAIKRLDCARSKQGHKEFLTEIAMLSGYKHKNLVSLLGFCDEGGEKILVYQHEVHGSLDKYLRGTNDGYNLTWIQRLNICIGAAHGLDYLHNGIGPQLRVIHRDIKSSNILLDENWEAKITDFGLSKIGTANQHITFLITSRAGTVGYCDPQYLKTGTLTKESDVYSFGVVLFEVLCGRPACIADNHDDSRSLARMARLYYKDKNLDEIIDRKIRDQIEEESLKIFSEIAYQCLQEDRQNRPTMTEVVGDLRIALAFQLIYKRLKALTFDHSDPPHYFVPGIGVCYGNELPSPLAVIRLCKSHNIQQMRLLSPNQAVLQSLRGSDIHVMLEVSNPDIELIASSLDNAQKWVQENVFNFWPDVKFRYIVVGNEDYMDGDIASHIQYAYDAMMNLHQVIELNGLHSPIKVSTAVDYMSWLSPGSVWTYFDPILVNTDAPLLARVYPYFSYGSIPGVISLPYAPNPIVQDEAKEFRKIFDPMRDALYSSLEKALELDGGSLDVVASETGRAFQVAVELGIYFKGDKYIFYFSLSFEKTIFGSNILYIL